jgi:hypothetical protein
MTQISPSPKVGMSFTNAMCVPSGDHVGHCSSECSGESLRSFELERRARLEESRRRLVETDIEAAAARGRWLVQSANPHSVVRSANLHEPCGSEGWGNMAAAGRRRA